MLGTHNYKGKLGDVDVDSSNTKNNNGHLFSTTIGANSYSNGLFSSIVGAYSIASSGYPTTTAAVSYTHLDVYKRQALDSGWFGLLLGVVCNSIFIIVAWGILFIRSKELRFYLDLIKSRL